MAISIDDIKKLRAMTGAGLADVKKALLRATSTRLRSSFVSVASLSLLSVATVRLQMVVFS